MATFYSDHFTSDGAGQTSLPTDPYRPPSGLAGGIVMRHTARFSDPNDAAAAADVIRFCQLRSGDRIHSILVSADGVFSAGTMDLGLHEAGDNHDGAVIDANLFATALDIATGFGQTDGFDESTTLEDEDRGKALWQLADEGGGTYTSDPGEVWEITGTLAGAVAGAGEVVVEIEYTRGI